MKVNRRFGGTYRFAYYLFGASFLPRLLVDIEDGDVIFLQNVGLYSNYTASQPKSPHSL
jgi:hypothetical protein